MNNFFSWINEPSTPPKPPRSKPLSQNDKLDAALRYAARGWHVFPCHWIVTTPQEDGTELLSCSCDNAKCKSKGKHPLTKNGFKDATTVEEVIRSWWLQSPNANVAIATGAVSGIWVLDYDNDETHPGPKTYHVTTPRPGRHYYYLYSDKIKARSGGGIDCKTDGGYVLAPPSDHVLGEYKLVDGREPIETPEEVIERFATIRKPLTVATKLPTKLPPSAQSDLILRATAYLEKIDPGIQGANGSIPMFRAAGALVHGFGLNDADAFHLLKTVYGVRCDPPWDNDKEIRHKIRSVRAKTWDKPTGYLLGDDGSDIDLSVYDAPSSNGHATENPKVEAAKVAAKAAIAKGKTAPRHKKQAFELTTPPGFMTDLVEYSMATSPFPSKTLSFAASLAMQAHLCGRRVRDNSDARPNMFIVVLAISGDGKNPPRVVNKKIALKAGVPGVLDKAASKEGLEDALIRLGRVLYQYDEIDEFIRAANAKTTNNIASGVVANLMEFYSNSHSSITKRSKAEDEADRTVDQPSLTVLGTATPKGFYDSLGSNLTANGFFSRLVIIRNHVDRVRGKPKILPIPEHLIETARWWKNWTPSGGNLENLEITPQPRIIQYTDPANAAMEEFGDMTNAIRNKAVRDGNPITAAAYTRIHEQAKKLAMNYACSWNHENPVIGINAVSWATGLAEYISNDMITGAGDAAESPFDADCIKTLKKISEAGEECHRWDLLRSTKFNAKHLDDILNTLQQRHQIESIEIPTAGRPAKAYRIIDGT